MERASKKDIPGISRQAEEEMLSKVVGYAEENLRKTKASIMAMDEDIKNLYDSIENDDKEALILWNDANIRLKEKKRGIDRLERACRKPYFGRIDFKDPEMAYAESYYVGRSAISKSPSEPVVIDWRAPIASVYYENNLGNVQYNVSSEGTFEVDLTRKRTYEIEDNKHIDFFDSEVVANDDLLTKYLAKNKKAVLGEIIATIQKEQNLIIRRSPRTNIIVQGCAGSGKTTVAMHRISYILYNYEEDFKPEDFYIIGSNKILLNYITSVLPDLDVYGISQMTMEDLFVRLLYEDWDKNKYKVKAIDKSDELNCVKGTLEWFKSLEKFCWDYEEGQIKREEIKLEATGALLVGERLIDTYCRDNPLMSMQAKCLMLNEILMSKFENETQCKNVTFPPKEKAALEKKYSTYFGKDDWKGSIFDLYRDFLEEQQRAGYRIEIPDNAFDIYDLAALAYLYKRIKEIDPIREASHVVIDEAQDFGMMAYSSLHYCLRNCTYTIMGDTSQNIYFGYGLNDWEELRSLILTGTYDAFGLLKKSYRNTVEISDFATEILRHGDFSIYPVEPIIRHGEGVKTLKCKDARGMLAETVTTVKNWEGKGYDTIAVVCRDEKETKKVAAELSKYLDIKDGTDDDAEFGNGIMVLPVAYTKGLEFDAVILFNPSEKSYPGEDGYVKLLYVAATRALHELVIIHRDSLSTIISAPVDPAKHAKELSAETLTKNFEYDRVVLTEKEQEALDKAEGAREMVERNYLGPKRIVIKEKVADKEKKLVTEHSSSSNISGDSKKISPRNTVGNSDKNEPAKDKTGKDKTGKDERINQSKFKFLEIPEGDLKPKGHSRTDSSVRWIKKDKKFVELASNYGVLRITPLSDDSIRIQFVKGQMNKIKASYWKLDPEAGFKWNIRESRDAIEITTATTMVRVEKKNGAVQFFGKDGKVLLSEKVTEPRQIENDLAWVYFDWSKKEKLKAKGILKDDFNDVTGKARYISFGGKKVRMPLVISNNGYGIATVAEGTTLFCGIPSYGPYIKTEGQGQVDYVFIKGSNGEDISCKYGNLS